MTSSNNNTIIAFLNIMFIAEYSYDDFVDSDYNLRVIQYYEHDDIINISLLTNIITTKINMMAK